MPARPYLESRIAVLETKWYEHRNVSIRELFDLLSDLMYGNANGYRYEMFGGTAEFENAFKRLAAKNGIHYIYIAAHGDAGSLQGMMQENIKILRVGRQIKKAAQRRGRLKGVYFGACAFGQIVTLEDLLANSQLTWIAGYSRNVDFISSSVLDLLFFHKFLGYRHRQGSTELRAIDATAVYLKNTVSGLMEELGFSLLKWDQRAVRII